MIVIEIHNRRYDVGMHAVVEELDARIEVDRVGLRVVEGDPDWEHIKDTVLDHPRTGEDLTFADDPELWACMLPEAFRTGDTVVKAHVARVVDSERIKDILIAAERAGGR